ncbi:MAG TPA: hypothetical protein PKG95_11855 [Anaerolineaceae bacterium]|nr:hypothetical protein [Anaerolineaceae bacterium]
MKFLKIFWLAPVILLVLSACAAPVGEDAASDERESLPTASPLTSGLQTIGGVVLGGGDQSPPGLMGGPVTFVYQVRLDGGDEINVTYTTLPPSPAADAQPHPRLSFHAGVITIGDYLTARGDYNAETRTLTVATADDFIETFTQKP